jgi:regulatory protein
VVIDLCHRPKARCQLKNLEDKAKHYALRLLSYRGRSVKELEERLRRKKFPADVVSSIISKLQRAGFLDDVALAEALKREATKTKFLSHYGAKRLMLSRGIAREIVDLVFSPDKAEDIDNARRLVEKKLRIIDNLPAEKKKRRLYQLLIRKGYSFEIIESVLKRINSKEV